MNQKNDQQIQQKAEQEDIKNNEVQIKNEIPQKIIEKQKNKKKYKTQITFNISDASSAHSLLQEVIKMNKHLCWSETFNKEKSKLIYLKPSCDDLDIIDIMKQKRIINRYPDIIGLAHKDIFAKYMKLCMDLYPDEYDFIPPTFIYPQEQDRLQNYMKKCPNACFIAKPQIGSQGEGIFLFRKLQDLTWKSNNGDLLIQRYIDKPLLIDGYKFDMRIYVPLIGSGQEEINSNEQMHSFVAKEGLARFCTEKYQKPTTENIKNQYVHLTNYSINKMSSNYVHEPDSIEAIQDINNGSKRTMEALYKQLEKMDIDCERIKESIQYSCQGIMQVLSNLIAHQFKIQFSKYGQGGEQKEINGKVFQIFGFDILLDENYKAWVLEINDHPSFNIYFENEFMNSKPKNEEILSLVDLHVKRQVMSDTIQFVLQKKSQYQEFDESYLSLTRIFPCQDTEHNDIYMYIYSLRQLFYKFCSIKDKSSLNSSQFEKLHSNQLIKKCGLQRVNLQLMFQKFSGNQKMIDFIQFCQIIPNLHQQCQNSGQINDQNIQSFIQSLQV